MIKEMIEAILTAWVISGVFLVAAVITGDIGNTNVSRKRTIFFILIGGPTVWGFGLILLFVKTMKEILEG